MLKEKLKLNTQIERSGRRLQRFEGRLLWLKAIPIGLGILLALLLIDLIFQVGSTWRLLYLLTCLAICTAFSVYAFWTGFVKKADPRRTARHLEAQSPDLGSSLINFLDLEETVEDASKPELTRTMAKHAQAEHAVIANRENLPQVVINLKLKPALKMLGVSLLVFASLCIFFWPFFKAHLARFFDPLGGHPPYSMTTLVFMEPLEEGNQIVFGKPLRIVVEARGHAPEQVELIYWPTDQPDQRYRTAMLSRGKNTFVHQIDQLEQSITVMAQTKNERSRTEPVDVDVYMNPKIESVEIEIHPPEYTGLPINKILYSFKELRTLQGSKIILRAKSNRPLQTGEIRMDRPLEADPHAIIVMQKSAEKTASGTFTAEESTGFTIRVTDTDGLHSEYSPRGSLFTVPDRPPSISIQNPEKHTLLAMDASINVVVEAFDDYGLREVRLHRAINGIFSAPIELPVEASARRATLEWALDFATIGVQAEDVVAIYAEAIDLAPEPQVSHSEIIKITAISVEDYNSLLRQEADMARVAQKYEALRDRFEEIMEQQEKLLEEVQSLKKELSEADDPQRRQELVEQLANLEEQQNSINEGLKGLANDMENTVRDTPLYDVESNFKKNLEEAAQSIRNSANSNQDALRQLAEKISQPELSPEQQAELADQLEIVIQAQRDQLMGQEQTIEEVEQSAQEMGNFHEMLKNFNRFAALTNQQRTLADTLAAYNREGRLSREDELVLRDLALDQKLISDELNLLVDKFRKDAEAGADIFPKAAASSLEFADAIEASRAQALSKRSSDAMLKGIGSNSAELSEATAAAMESLLSQCNGSMGQMSHELDRRLSATQPSSSSAGNTFEQMLENMRMRYSVGNGSSFGSGQQGASQSSGFSTSSSQTPSLAGNESLAGEGSSTQQNSETGSSGIGISGANESVDSTGEEGSLNELEEQRLKSESLRGESLFIEHDDIIDAYFKKITD